LNKYCHSKNHKIYIPENFYIEFVAGFYLEVMTTMYIIGCFYLDEHVARIASSRGYKRLKFSRMNEVKIPCLSLSGLPESLLREEFCPNSIGSRYSLFNTGKRFYILLKSVIHFISKVFYSIVIRFNDYALLNAKILSHLLSISAFIIGTSYFFLSAISWKIGPF